MTLGPRTREILRSHGLNDTSLASIERGEVSWDLIPRGTLDRSDLLLTDNEDGGFRYEVTLGREEVDVLLDAWDFERRLAQASDHPTSFAPGTFEDWTGVRPDTNWVHFLGVYRKAAIQLADARSRELTEPWLFLCRHTLELHLKAVIILGQEALGLDADLPDHHDLQRLWTAAYPFVSLKKDHDEKDADIVRELVRDYHLADPRGTSLRYPVGRDNKSVRLPSFLQRFSPSHHVARFVSACDYLAKVTERLQIRGMFRSIFASDRSS